MEFGIFDLLGVLGALAFFVYGMKMMSEGIQRAAGSQMRNILRTMTKNRFLGVFTGFLTTAMVQSSSATTVMTVSFVNAGLLTLVESAGVMMGANIGTTITGWIVSLLGFKVKLSAYSIPLFGLGVPLLFSNRGKFKYWGEFLIGFAILFLGLEYLKDAVPDLKSNPGFLAFFKDFAQYGFISRILFVLIGTLITIIVQSSSAAMAITLTMCVQGWIPFEVAAAMILGENIGTTITAELASLVGNTNAKRSARIHSLFNVIGVTWMVILLPFFLPILSGLTQRLFGIQDPYLSAVDMPIALSAFHTSFNLLNVTIMLGFTNLLVNLAIKTVKHNADDEENAGLRFINSAIRTPELALIELQKETAHFGTITSRMSKYCTSLINAKDHKEEKKMIKKLKKYEAITDDLEIEITQYITKLANQELTPQTSVKLRSILNICNDLERIGDIYCQMAVAIENKIEEKIELSKSQVDGINRMTLVINEAFEIMKSNLENPKYDTVNLKNAQEKENEINKIRDELRNYNLTYLGEKSYSVPASMVFNNIFSSLEKIGDHILNISESIKGEI